MTILSLSACFDSDSDTPGDIFGDATLPETESEVTEPEVTEPEVTEPEVTEPEVTEPEVTEPEVTEPEVTEPEVTEPEVTEPEVTEPAETEPELPPAPSYPEGTEFVANYHRNGGWFGCDNAQVLSDLTPGAIVNIRLYVMTSVDVSGCQAYINPFAALVGTNSNYNVDSEARRVRLPKCDTEWVQIQMTVCVPADGNVYLGGCRTDEATPAFELYMKNVEIIGGDESEPETTAPETTAPETTAPAETEPELPPAPSYPEGTEFVANKLETGGWFASENAKVLTGLEPGATITIQLMVQTNVSVATGAFLHSYPTTTGDNNHYKVGGEVAQVALGNCVNEWKTLQFKVIVPEDGNVYLGGAINGSYSGGAFAIYMKDVRIVEASYPEGTEFVANKKASGGWYASENAKVLTGLEPGATITIQLMVKTNMDLSGTAAVLHSYPTSIGDNNHYKVGGVVKQIALGKCVDEWQSIKMEIIVPDDGNVYLGGAFPSSSNDPGAFEIYMKDVRVVADEPEAPTYPEGTEFVANAHWNGSSWYGCDNATVLTGLEPGSLVTITLMVKTNVDVSATNAWINSFSAAVGKDDTRNVNGFTAKVELGNCVDEWQQVEMDILVPADGNVYLGGCRNDSTPTFELYMKDVAVKSTGYVANVNLGGWFGSDNATVLTGLEDGQTVKISFYVRTNTNVSGSKKGYVKSYPVADGADKDPNGGSGYRNDPNDPNAGAREVLLGNCVDSWQYVEMEVYVADDGNVYLGGRKGDGSCPNFTLYFKDVQIIEAA